MGRLAQSSIHHGDAENSRRLASLRKQRRKLAAQMAKVDEAISRHSEKQRGAPSAEAIDSWLDELSSGLKTLPPLPPDFSRADLYNDHD
jgi:hypothetical protein